MITLLVRTGKRIFKLMTAVAAVFGMEYKDEEGERDGLEKYSKAYHSHRSHSLSGIIWSV